MVNAGRLSQGFLAVCRDPLTTSYAWKTELTIPALGTFYIQTWDDYHTKTLSFGYVSGPVEGVFMIVIVHLLTAYHGSGDYWRQPALPALGFAKHASIPHVLYDLPFSEWFASLAYCILVYNTVSRYVGYPNCRAATDFSRQRASSLQGPSRTQSRPLYSPVRSLAICNDLDSSPNLPRLEPRHSAQSPRSIHALHRFGKRLQRLTNHHCTSDENVLSVLQRSDPATDIRRLRLAWTMAADAHGAGMAE